MSTWGLFSSGSYCPVPNSEGEVDRKATLENFARLTDGKAIAVTGGEWRRDPENGEENWLAPTCHKIFKALSPVSVPGITGAKYWHYPVRKLLGCVLALPIWAQVKLGKMPELPYAAWAAEDGPDIDSVKGNARRMRGIPTAKALKLFAGLPLMSDFMERQVVRQVRAILKEDPETVISFELPAELAFVSSPLGKQRIARRMAKSLERIIRACPKGTRFAFHLCWGDLDHKPFVPKRLQSNHSKVILITELVLLDVWEEGWILFAIHDPLCDGENYPEEEERQYTAYSQLPHFPEGVTYVLGILKAGYSTSSTVRLAQLMASKLRARGVARFALAPPCGDSRTATDDVERHWRTGREAIAILEAA